MKYLPLIWAGLWRKPARTVFTFLSLTVAFTLFGMLQGIGAGFDTIIANARADRLFTNSRFGVPLPRSYGEQIEKIPGVRMISPRNSIGGYFQGDPKNTGGVVAMDDRVVIGRNEWLVTKEQIAKWNAEPDGMLLGAAGAERYGLKEGDTLTLRSTNTDNVNGGRDFAFKVSVIFRDRDNPNDTQFYIPHYEYVNELRVQGKDQYDRIMILIDDPDQGTEIARTIDRMFANSPAPTLSSTDRDALVSNVGSFGNVKFFVNAIVGAVLFMILFITTNTMMQAFRERTGEFAVLKTLGFGDNAVAALIVAEALLQCLLGAALGLALSTVFVPYLQPALRLPGTIFVTPWPVLVAGMVVAALVAILCGAIPAMRARRLSVVEAFRVQ
jgi:putative ABC transport system permease protein